MPKPLPHLVLVALRIEAVQLDCAAGGFKQRRQHLDGCGLPCPIGAEEREYLSGGHVERDIVHGGKSAEGFHQVLHPDHVPASESFNTERFSSVSQVEIQFLIMNKLQITTKSLPSVEGLVDFQGLYAEGAGRQSGERIWTVYFNVIAE